MKYIKTFRNHTGYEVFTATTEFILPNVSHCINENDVHYNPIIKVTGVILDKGELSLKKGDSDTLIATVNPSDASNKNVIWSSSDESVATVDSNGVVSGIGVGNADITVTTEDGGFTAQCATTVKSNSVITYRATEKLPETTSIGDVQGLHTNSFFGTSGQILTKVSHTFEDGVGTVTFNGDIAKFGDSAFYSCSGLTSIEIPDSVTNIGGWVFSKCSGLTSIEITDSVTSIGDYAFSGCSSLASANIQGGSIGYSAFIGCAKLTEVTMGDNVTSIGNLAFAACISLSSVTIGSGVTTIGEESFNGCIKLTSIEIPDSVTTIGNRAFYNCSGLTTCTIGNSVTSIGVYAFRFCSGLTSITSNAMTAPTIQSSAFQYVKTGGTLYVPQGSTGYDVWMQNANYYLGLYNWTKVEQ